MRRSERLDRLRDRIRNTFTSAHHRSAEIELGGRTARYSGSVPQPTAVYGVYSDRKDVESTVTALKERGFGSGDISVVFPNPSVTKGFAVDKNTKAPEGALTGGSTGLVIGGVLGWLAGMGTLAIPGIGPLLAAGPIVAAPSGCVSRRRDWRYHGSA